MLFSLPEDLARLMALNQIDITVNMAFPLGLSAVQSSIKIVHTRCEMLMGCRIELNMMF